MVDESQEFRQFAQIVEREIARYDFDPNAEITPIQKAQVDRLIGLEEEFKRTIIRRNWGKKVYGGFIHYIVDERKNILLARPFWRERKGAFHDGIVPALQAKQWRTLFKYRVNYQFVKFVLKHFPWPANSPLHKLGKDIASARQELIVTNLPLAISRARMFWSKTPKAHLTFMDFINLCVEGFITGIDKFEPPYDEIFRSVLIQRASGNMIEAYSQTMIHFYPSDKRKIYRANKYMSKKPHGGVNYDDMLAQVNVDIPNNKHANKDEISDLISAASHLSADTKTVIGDDVPNDIARYAAPDDMRPDTTFEALEANAKMRSAIQKLPLINQKLLRMMGIRP